MTKIRNKTLKNCKHFKKIRFLPKKECDKNMIKVMINNYGI